jgi:phthiocerol/phenolphthiocerol synthesis type-I polyketide synthase C
VTRKVAILATSYRLPSTTPAHFWDDLLAGRDLVTAVESGRWSASAYLHPHKAHPGSAYTFAAGSIGDVAGFDASFFGISPREASLMDPQQRLLLELAWETFENAAIPPSSLRSSNCGVYIGISSSDYAWRMADDLAAIDSSFATGNTASIAANRLSYVFDLRGPSMAIDTACSSSLVAFHQACRAIAAGEIPQALAGAVSLHLHPLGFVSFSKASMLSRSGRCRVFDASADGYVRSEGGGVILLKDYERAVADGNPILAIVAHTCVNTDGHKSGLTVPSSAAQAALLTSAYRHARIRPEEIDYIEAHGTGTAVGDPIEARALSDALGRYRSRSKPLPIGSVKSNVGHLEAASGMAGLIKALHCLRHRTIPAHIGIETPNPNIPFDEWNLEVVTANRALKASGRLIIGVNSFGFGGANAHVILESHTAEEPATPALPKVNAVPIMVSAHDAAALKLAARDMARFIAGQPQSALYDIAYQSVHGRERHAHRAVIFGRVPQTVATMLERFADGETQSTPVESGTPVKAPLGAAFIYSGNGSQWAGMGSRLLSDATFRTAVREVDKLFSRYADYSLEDELAGRNGESRYELTEIAQPALFALQVGITEMLRRRGVLPIAVAGHSVGEVAAAWASGSLSLAAAVSVIHHRSTLQGTTKGTGGMTAVSLDQTATLQLLTTMGLNEILCIAGVNSGSGVTIAGPVPALDQLERELVGRGIARKRLDLDYPFHSPAMDSLFPELRRALAHLEPEDGKIAFHSTVTGSHLGGKSLNAEYWWRNIREPVQFERVISGMARAGINIYLEIGPHALLRRYIQDCLATAGVDGRVIGTGQRADDSPAHIYSAGSQALIAGAKVDWQRLLPWRGRDVRLPNYPWQREALWHQVTSSSLGLLTRTSEHPLLGHALNQSELTWESELDTSRYPWLAEHVVGGATVFPGTGYAELALAAAFRWQPGDVAEIEDLEIRAPLLLAAEPSRTVRCAVDPSDGQFTIRSREQLGRDPWTAQAVGRILREPSARALTRELGDCPTRAPDFTAHSHALLTAAAGLDYGPTFQAVSHGWVDADAVCAVFESPQVLQQQTDQYHLHPALLDCAFQLIIQLLQQNAADYHGSTFVPTRIGHLSCRAGSHRPRYARARLLRRGPHSVCVDYELFDENRQCLALLQEVRLRSIPLQRVAGDQVRCFEYVAVPRPASTLDYSIDDAAFRDLDRALRRAFADSDVRHAHRLYGEEVDPLLDALCSRFAAEGLGNMGAAASIAADAPNEAPPFRRHLTQIAGTDTTAAGEDPDTATAQDIWNSLIADYADFFPIVHAVGCVGTHLTRLLQGECALSGVLPAHLSPAVLLRQVLGTEAKLRIVNALREQIGAALGELPEGQRLGIVEISSGPPALASELCRTLDFDRADYRFVSNEHASLEDARRVQEKYPAITITAMDAEQHDPCGCLLAIVTLDFRSLPDSLGALEYARRHLATGGMLVILAQHPAGWLDFVYGGDPGWWGESADGTLRSRQQPVEFWQQRLRQNGFSKLRLQEHARGSACGAFLLYGILESPQDGAARELSAARHWLLLADPCGYSEQLAAPLHQLLRQQGNHVSVAGAADKSEIAAAIADCERSGPLHGIVLLSGLGCPRAHDVGALVDRQVERCASAAALIQACEWNQTSALCCFVTANVSRHLLSGRHADPDASSGLSDVPLAGFVRSMMNEAVIGAVRLIDLELDELPVDQTAWHLARELAIETAEQEIIITALGARYAPRLRSTEAPRDSSAQDKGASGDRRALGFAVPGQLRNLRWTNIARSALVEDQVEVAVKATGVNFRDVMYALGLLSDEGVERGFAGASLGLEFSGIVTGVGPQVSGLATGDRVFGFAPSSFSDRLSTRAGAVSPIPGGMSFEAAATIPSTFFTAYYSLHTLARLRKGEKVLIHGAAGGVGLAAIQVAKWCGAEIYATAGSEEKRDFLRLLGVEYIFDSRSLGFADQILQLTGGVGVDVVLNSLAGEAINRNFRVLRPFGRFLELGKRDFYENTRIGLRPLRNNISYFAIDADQLMSGRPDLTRELFAEIMQLFRERVFHPLPYQTFEAADVIDAFRHMQQARQIGKIVVTYGNGIPQPYRPASATTRRLTLSPEATYLVTGGLSGFGLRTAEWLADRGARNLVLIGRRGAVADEAQTALARLERQGVRVQACGCDVTQREALAGILSDIAREWPPLRGVVHAASVIEDSLIREMTVEQIRRVFAPKVLGALHLHELTRELALDFFVLYSSATTLFGNPGQGNYVAANAALEALARSRRAAGLRATCVRWGVIDDVGFLARNPKLKDALQARMGGQALQSAVALETLESMLLADRSDLGILEVDWRALRRFLPTAGSPKFFDLTRNVGHTEGDEEASFDLHRMLRELPEQEVHNTVADMLKVEVGEILRIAPDKIDATRSMHEMGFDSLMGVELVVAVENRFGTRLPVMALSDGPTVAKLATWIITQLRGDSGSVGATADADTRAQIQRVASQHAVDIPGSAEIERIADKLRVAETASTRRMIQ